ncbi:sigma-70 family RNA polymerase sigma factor [Kocuria sp.]|uniref:sigma-70 family RNA polymerase sigma factor n=1 Tax=Kocuria sp. TaxID=1871328 RepID=UPI0026DBA3AF|nr:sigma-70 family RNA polymerase sigma factor [Kocuria sp.]MDO4918376.1 sigma-70 family RNA polymerase sigma factor [Kocuria sp.]
MPDSPRSGSHGFADHDELPASDEHLLTAVREGDTSAFGELFERHRGAALAVARMHSRNEADAQDLVSEAFTRVLGLLREGRGPREFLRAYLVTAVSRLAADRANDLSRTRPEDPQPEGPLDRVEFFDDIVVRQVDSAVVARAFASLPERWQEVLWYLEVEGRRPRQVASVVGSQPNAVSALGKRAREGLRAAYMQEHVSAQALEDCHRYSSQLGAFARGSLTPSRTAVVQEHLDGCRRCTAEYLQLQDLGLGMRGWILPVLAGLPLWSGAGGRLSEILAGLPLWGAGTATATAVSAGTHAVAHDAAGPVPGSAAPHAAAPMGEPAPGTGAGAASAGPGSSGGATTLAGTATGWAVAGAALLVAAAAAVGIVAVAQGEDEARPAVASSPEATSSTGASGTAATGASSPAAARTGDAAPRPGSTAAASDHAAPADSTRPSGERGGAAGGSAAPEAPAASAAQGGTRQKTGGGSGSDGASSGASAPQSPRNDGAGTPFLPGTQHPGAVPSTPSPQPSLPVTVPPATSPSAQVVPPTAQPSAEVPTAAPSAAVPTTAAPTVAPDPGIRPEPSPSDVICVVTGGSIGLPWCPLFP